MLVEDSHVDLTTATGPMRVYVFHPQIPEYPKARFPGVVLYSEIYQAGRGYIVAAPSIYHEFAGPEPFAYDGPGTDRGNALKIEKTLESYNEDNKVTIDHLLSLPTCTGRIGATGICIGGHLAFRACLDKRVSAAVCFFPTDIHLRSLGKGKNDDSLKRVKEMSRAELIMIFGTKDPHVSREGRDLIRQTLYENDVFFSFFEIAGAQHAFVRDENSKGRYDATVTGNCLHLLFELFERRLKLDLGDRGTPVQGDPEC